MKVYIVLQHMFDDGSLDYTYVLGARVSKEKAEALLEETKESEVQGQIDQMEDENLTEEEKRFSAEESLYDYYKFEIKLTDLDEELIYEHSPEGKISLKES